MFVAGEVRETAPQESYALARAALEEAERAAQVGDIAVCAGLMAKAAIATAHARLAERGASAETEIGILRRAGLGRAEEILAAVGTRPHDLSQSVLRMRIALRLQT